MTECWYSVFPGADKVTVKTTKDGREYPMSKEDDAGYFAVLLSGRKIPEYTYLVEQEGEQIECYDAYAFPVRSHWKKNRSLSMVSAMIFTKNWVHIR